MHAQVVISNVSVSVCQSVSYSEPGHLGSHLSTQINENLVVVKLFTTTLQLFTVGRHDIVYPK